MQARRPDAARLGEGRHVAADALDLVAQLGRVLEPQLLGRLEHLLLERDRELLELVARHALHLVAATAARARHVRLVEREELGDVGDALDDRERLRPVLLVVRELHVAAAVRLLERALDRLGHLVGVHQHAAVDVPRRAADRLDERRPAAEEALLVGIENRDQRDLRQVEALAQEVHADEDVELAEPQVADDLDALERVDLRVQVARLHARFEQVVGEVLGHLLRQGRHEHALADLLAPPDLVQEIVDLVLRRPQLDLGVDEEGRPDQLLRDARRLPQLPRARRRRDEDQLRHLLEELVEPERPVVERRREPEPVVDQRLLARAVALVHAADLRHRLMRLVDEDHEVVREVVEQRERVRARRGALPGSASSSRSRCRSRAPASARGRTRCAGGCGAPRASARRPRTSRPAPRARTRISLTARSIVGCDVTYSVAGQMARLSSFANTSPVSGSKCVICSTRSPKNDTRYAVSTFAGCTSRMSPFTRKRPRPSTTSFRTYCESISFRSTASRSCSCPVSR